MIFLNPSNIVLFAADIIAFFDPNVPGWDEIVINAVEGVRLTARDFTVVDIPVDSTDATAVQVWRDRIAVVRSCAPATLSGSTFRSARS